MSQRTSGRLGFLITNLGGGGAERVVSNLSQGLCDRPRQLMLLEDEIVYPFEGPIHVLDVPISRSVKKHRRLWQMSRGLVRLRRLKRSQRLETCISFLTWPNLYNILSRGDERVIISVRNNPSLAIRGSVAPVLKILMRLLYPMADHIVAISEDVRRDLIDHFGVSASRITTIYNPIQLQEVVQYAHQPLPPSLRELSKYPTITSMGRLAIQKGQWHLVRAFKQIRHQVDDARLLLMGVGPYQDYLIDLARGLDMSVWIRGQDTSSDPLDHDVIFWGFDDNPFPILKACDIFAFPSLWEGLGNVLIESLACGVPVASADCRSGPREILTARTSSHPVSQTPEWADFGVLLPVCDGQRHSEAMPLTEEETIWAHTLTELLEDQSLRRRYAEQGRRRARDFDQDQIIDQWRSLLQVSDFGPRTKLPAVMRLLAMAF